jgi:two-component system response regulator FlrC
MADVLVVEDDTDLREALCATLRLAGLTVAEAAEGTAALAVLAGQPARLVVTDIQMRPLDGIGLLRRLRVEHPGLPVLLMTAYATVQQAVEAMREGAVDYLVKPFASEVLLGKVGRYLAAAAEEGDGVVAVDPLSRELLGLAVQVASSEATVLITGESGTGKEVIARYIHRHSARAQGPFVAINCAAIPDNMLEAVLFGYEKGAFTGAYRASPGKFELARGGTLLLDEVSEMELGLQAKLLRVLQEREVERLGGHQVIALDLRVLATSNRDMRRAVSEGRFREDLYYRLNVFPLHLPALRERPADILPLAERLIARAAGGRPGPLPRLSEEAAGALSSHPWPGNVRELDNVLQRAVILQRGGVIRRADLHFEGAPAGGLAAQEPEAEGALGADLRSHERELIITALREERGSRQAAAHRLGISPRTLRYKMQRLRAQGRPIPASVGLDEA